jgi:hypothetical protein
LGVRVGKILVDAQNLETQRAQSKAAEDAENFLR